MIVRKSTRLRRLVLGYWKRLVFAAGYAVVVVLIYRADVFPVAIPVAIPAMLGTALSILLGFRTNSAYNRWWEARKIWGGIVNDSRTFARQVTSLFMLPEGASDEDMTAMQREMIYRQIAWNYVLARSLRGQDRLADVEATLAEDEIVALRSQDNNTNAILQTQAHRLQVALREGYLDTLRFLPIEGTLTRLCDHMGKCERIKNTVFPRHYGVLILAIAWIFFLLLPSGLVEALGWGAVPVAVTISVLFGLMERIAEMLQDPFENKMTDTPMSALSRTIEINLRQQLGETDLPEKIQPVDGVLM